jgi:hypothetical protein
MITSFGGLALGGEHRGGKQSFDIHNGLSSSLLRRPARALAG